MSVPPTHRTRIGSQWVDLPLVPVADDCSIALLICVDLGVHFAERAGQELAERLGPARPELVVSVATMGIPLAIEVTRSLGLDDYVILHKTPKIHLGESLAEPVRSITTDHPQMLRMDPGRAEVVRGRRVAVVDDVISTGASTAAALALVRRVGGEPVAVGVLMTEGGAWRETLGPDSAGVVSLGSVPLFRPGPRGAGLREEWGPPGTPESPL
jgi:adenine/guanine phosphoribosyltransferase-like PRPP-binding protein